MLFTGPLGPPCAHPLTSFDHKNNTIKGCFKDVTRMDVQTKEDCVVYSIGLHDHWEFEKAIHGKRKLIFTQGMTTQLIRFSV